jgi:hypothetical protein
MNISTFLNRRRVLRGLLAGGAVTVGLPILDCMLNNNGTAFANTGAPIPVRFATWFWGLGFGEGNWVPKETGANYKLPISMEALEPIRKKVNLFTGGSAKLDGTPANSHFTPAQVAMTGKAESRSRFSGSLDTIIADVIGQGRRFRSIEVTCSGDSRNSWSVRPDGTQQLPEVSPVALYARIFGPEFKDPNAAEFRPDPVVLIRKSALSAVTEERQALNKILGAADRARMDIYFSSLRALEQKLDVQLQKPAPMLACAKPAEPEKEAELAVTLVDVAMERHNLFAGLLAQALACGQTNVVNLSITQGQAGLRLPGRIPTHHSLTHEEPIDPALGYQKECAIYQAMYMKGLYDFAMAMEGIKEGDQSLLDRMVIFGFTDHGAPRLHSVHNVPMITVGGAGGKLKTGLHVSRAGDSLARVGLTIQQAMGVNVSSWGTGSNEVTSPVSEVIA